MTDKTPKQRVEELAAEEVAVSLSADRLERQWVYTGWLLGYRAAQADADERERRAFEAGRECLPLELRYHLYYANFEDYKNLTS